MKTILVVEDFVAVQAFLREMLESKGYRTLGATDGIKAYEILTNSPGVDLVLADYHMPKSNGFDLLARLKTNKVTNRIPIIFLTAESDPQVIKRCKEIGFSAWVKKPYRAEALFIEIEKALAGNPIQWELFA